MSISFIDLMKTVFLVSAAIFGCGIFFFAVFALLSELIETVSDYKNRRPRLRIKFKNFKEHYKAHSTQWQLYLDSVEHVSAKDGRIYHDHFGFNLLELFMYKAWYFKEDKRLDMLAREKLNAQAMDRLKSVTKNANDEL